MIIIAAIRAPKPGPVCDCFRDIALSFPNGFINENTFIHLFLPAPHVDGHIPLRVHPVHVPIEPEGIASVTVAGPSHSAAGAGILAFRLRHMARIPDIRLKEACIRTTGDDPAPGTILVIHQIERFTRPLAGSLASPTKGVVVILLAWLYHRVLFPELWHRIRRLPMKILTLMI